MDRIAGVTGAQGRERLLRAAADVSPSTLAMGSALVPPDLHAVGDQEWAALFARVVTALSRAGISAQTGTAQ